MKFKWLRRLFLLINSLVCKPKKPTKKVTRVTAKYGSSVNEQCKKEQDNVPPELEIEITEDEK